MLLNDWLLSVVERVGYDAIKLISNAFDKFIDRHKLHVAVISRTVTPKSSKQQMDDLSKWISDFKDKVSNNKGVLDDVDLANLNKIAGE